MEHRQLPSVHREEEMMRLRSGNSNVNWGQRAISCAILKYWNASR